jgi:hypothetical protein
MYTLVLAFRSKLYLDVDIVVDDILEYSCKCIIIYMYSSSCVLFQL